MVGFLVVVFLVGADFLEVMVDFLAGADFLDAIADFFTAFLIGFFATVFLADADVFVITGDFFTVFLGVVFFAGADFLDVAADFLTAFLAVVFLYRGFLYLSGCLSMFTNSINVRRNAVIAKLKNKMPEIMISVLPIGFSM